MAKKITPEPQPEVIKIKNKKGKAIELNLEQFHLEDTVYTTTLSQKHKKRAKFIPNNPKRLCAFLPGTIKTIYVNVGDQIKRGEKILILEAMKMNNELLAPIDGTIKKIYFQTNEIVPKNAVLVEFK